MQTVSIDRAAVLAARKAALDHGTDDSPEHCVSSAVSNARRYDPASGVTSLLTDMSTGDWSWKPERDRVLDDRMVTYRPPRHPLEGIRF